MKRMFKRKHFASIPNLKDLTIKMLWIERKQKHRVDVVGVNTEGHRDRAKAKEKRVKRVYSCV